MTTNDPLFPIPNDVDDVIRRGTAQTVETAAWERSEPGSGPSPVYPDLDQDPAVRNGWRRDSPPAAY